jgi:hypothetical protein
MCGVVEGRVGYGFWFVLVGGNAWDLICSWPFFRVVGNRSFVIPVFLVVVRGVFGGAGLGPGFSCGRRGGWWLLCVAGGVVMASTCWVALSMRPASSWGSAPCRIGSGIGNGAGI